MQSIWWKRAGTIVAILTLVGGILTYVRAQELKLNEVAVKQQGLEGDIKEIKESIGKILDILLDR